MSRSRFVALAVAVLALVTAGLAQGHTNTYFNTLTIKFRSGPGGDRFNGGVHSAKPGCEKGRRVVVLRTNPGGDVRIGADVTGGRGRWQVDPVGRSVPRGAYYARMREKVLRRGGGHNHTCAAVVTPPITVQ